MIANLIGLGMAGGPAAEGQGSIANMMLPMVFIFGIFYFMLIRPQQRKEKERRKMIDEIKSGDRIMFGGGILGTISNVKETTFTVKIADNVKIEVSRGAVSRVLDKGDKIPEETN